MGDSPARVFVTGAGIVAPLGTGGDAFGVALREARLGLTVRAVAGVGGRAAPECLAGHVVGFSPAEALGRSGIRNLSRESAMFAAAGRAAANDASLDGRVEPEQVGVFAGTMFAGLEEYAALYDAGIEDPSWRVGPGRGPQTGFNAPASELSIRLPARGPNLTVTTGRASALDAVAQAATYVAQARADAILAGGVDALSPAVLDAVRCSGDASVPGEGAAAFVVERRPPPEGGILCEIAGWAAAATPQEAIADVLGSAALRPEEVDAVFCSIAGDAAADAEEAAALARSLPGTPVHAVKGATGECFGAGGAFQVAAAIASLRHDVVPATVRLEALAGGPELTKEPVRTRVQHTLVIASSEGSAAAVVLAKTGGAA